jgi:cytochrome c oxidase assembly protein subunit 11
MRQEVSRSRSNRRTITGLLFAVVAMFGFGYALVPLYYAFCDITGLGGRANREAIAMTEFDGDVDRQRTITIEFIASVNADAPWEFAPSVSKMQIHPGEFYHTSYIARNLSSHELIAQAVPSIAPAEGSLHFKKIECFCFSRQTFKPGERKDMPVVFRVDPEIPSAITTVTLSYTFFRIDNPDS